MIDKHHILNRSRWWSNIKENIVSLEQKQHKALHNLFANEWPREQILTLVCNINMSALTEEFRNDILNLLSETDLNYYYKDWILLPNT